MCLDWLKPFCALLSSLSVTLFSRLFIAWEIILYEQFSSDIGCQFFICVWSPFFGISQIAAVLKLGVRLPLLKQVLA